MRSSALIRRMRTWTVASARSSLARFVIGMQTVVVAYAALFKHLAGGREEHKPQEVESKIFDSARYQGRHFGFAKPKSAYSQRFE
jgi:hypothetical protein